MNKQDIILIFVIIFISLSFFGIIKLLEKDTDKQAVVYYENKEILRFNLTSDGIEEFEVTGYNGKIIIERQGKRVRISEETSLYNICSKQGFIEYSYQTLVCLPNKILIKIVEDSDKIDAVVGIKYEN